MVLPMLYGNCSSNSSSDGFKKLAKVLKRECVRVCSLDAYPINAASFLIIDTPP